MHQGAQEPRTCHVPPYVASSGAEVIECAEIAGLILDPWQQLVLTHACGERADGRWASYEVGLSVPRQNGKGSILEARELAGAFVFEEKLIIHSAHEQATSTEHFRRLLTLMEGVPEYDQRIQKVVRGKGSEAIELKGGIRIFFKTRTGGGGRGLTGDLVVLDEAMILPEEVAAALVPTMAARSIQGDPQLWYAGSPVDQTKHDHGAVFSRVRSRGLSGAERLTWMDWSVDAKDPDDVTPEIAADKAAWAQANPGLGVRISEEHVQNEQDGALGPREFAVERLGVGDWVQPDTVQGQGLDVDLWLALIDRDSTALDPVSIAFDVTPDRKFGSIVAAGERPDGDIHVEVIEHRPGTGWIVDRLKELNDSQSPLEILCDQAGPAMSLVKPLEDAGLTIRTLTTAEYAQSYGTMVDAVADGTVRHLGTAELTAAVRGAVRRTMGDAFAWSRKGSKVDISPLVASTIAVWSASSAAATFEPMVRVGR